MNSKLNLLQLTIIGLLILTFPYNISNATTGTLSILSFIIMMYQKSFNLKQLLKEPIIVTLFGFILFTYASTFWSNVPILHQNSDFNMSINRFKYYFLLIPSIYFSNFSKQDIQKLLWTIILAPLPLIIIYYLNHFDLIHYYSVHYDGKSTYLRADLQDNIFILFSSILLYIYLLFNIKEKKIFKSFILFIALLLIGTSLVIDPITSSRIVNIAFFLTIPLGIFYTFKTKYILPVSLVVSILSLIVLLQEKDISAGIREFKTALEEKNFSGSWGHRTAYAIVGIDIFLKNPFFGTGINDVTTEIIGYKKIDPKYFRGEENMSRLHNDHLLILDQVGIIGYAMFLYIIFLLLKVKLSDKKIEIFKNLFIISFMFLMLGEHYLNDKYSTNLFAIVIALILLYKKLDEEKNSFIVEKS